MIKERFLECKYDEKLLDEAIETVIKDPEKKPLKKSEDGIMVPFITGYLKEALIMKKAIQKNWHLLISDPVIGKHLSARPQVIFRSETNLRDYLTCSYVKETTAKPFLTSGFQNCGHCKACQDSDTLRRKRILEEFIWQDGKQKYKRKDFSTCDTKNVVYLIQCLCGLREHCRNIRLGLHTYNLSLHYKLKHNQNPSGSLFWVVEVVKSWWRGENPENKLNKKEGEWIYKLGTLAPGGLNSDFELKCFLKED